MFTTSCGGEYTNSGALYNGRYIMNLWGADPETVKISEQNFRCFATFHPEMGLIEYKSGDSFTVTYKEMHSEENHTLIYHGSEHWTLDGKDIR